MSETKDNHERDQGAQGGIRCYWCGGLMGADEDTCQHEDCGRGAKTEAE